MKKKQIVELDKNDVNLDKLQELTQTKASTSREYLFKRTYIGMLGRFLKNKTYELTQEEYDKLKDDIV
jgi:hypothetical protein